jgi:alpha-mannosidase
MVVAPPAICWQASEFFPKITSSTAFHYLEKIKQQLLQKPALIPVWQDDLYLEFHRGCYTTHADQKTANRRSENQLYEAELWSSLATLSSGLDYPQALLASTWKKVLLNQFHDILPGTSIPEVFVTANQDWQVVQATTEQIINQALKAIATQIHYPNLPQINAKPLVIFNSLNWQRSDLVSVKVDSPNWQVYDLDGQAVITQLTAENELLFLAENITAIGYQLYWLCPQPRELSSPIVENQPILENTYLRVTIDPETGDIQSLWDKIQQREVLAGNGNQLQFFADQGQYWDAWNIDPHYANYPLSPTILESIEILETGPIRWRIRVIKQFQSSQFCQDYLLEIHSPILKIQTQVTWLESQVLVKAAFPLNLTSETITYEVPCAVIERPTCPQTAAEKAKWEVSALHWADLSDRHQNYGVSLLNDCKYGYDGQPSQLRLTLLRSPNWPDPNCDRGEHHFTYALYPHLGDWKTAQTVRQGYQLNRPLRVYFPTVIKKISKGNLSSRQSLLTLAADNLCLMAFKRQENDPQAWILRLYEYQGQSATFSLQSPFPLAITTAVNLLEEETDLTLSISSWKIASFSLKYQND